MKNARNMILFPFENKDFYDYFARADINNTIRKKFENTDDESYVNNFDSVNAFSVESDNDKRINIDYGTTEIMDDFTSCFQTVYDCNDSTGKLDKELIVNKNRIKRKSENQFSITLRINEKNLSSVVSGYTLNNVDFSNHPKGDKHLLFKNSKVLKNNESCEKSDLTDLFFASFCYHIAPVFVMTNLRTTYSNSGHPVLANKYLECIRYCNEYGYNLYNDYAEYICENDGIEMQEKIIHKYKNVKLSDGKKHRIEVIPYVELKLTETGKKLFNSTWQNTLIDDDIQNVVESLTFLRNAGLIHHKGDCFVYSSYIYSNLNKTWYKERKTGVLDSLENVIMFYDDEKDDDIFYYGKSCEKHCFSDIESESVINSVLSVLYISLDKRCNKDNIIAAFKMYYVDELTQEQIAKRLNVRQQTINDYLSKAKKTIFASPVVNEKIHSLLMA